MPEVLAAATFVAGGVLLFSGAMPAAVGRLELVDRRLGLLGIEVSHFAASAIGTALLLLARGLHRRLDAAWLLAVVLLAIGATASLAKGWDFEEASLLLLACIALLPFRRYFYRQSSLLDEPVSRSWIVAIAVVLAAAALVTAVEYRHADVATRPWWHFALYGEAPRSVRAAAGAVALATVFAVQRLLRADRSPLPPASEADLERVRPLVEACPRTYANLVYRGDKSVLHSRDGDAFLMYGQHGRSWIAMGDPVGSPTGSIELLWRFRDLCDRFDRWCVFFEVRDEQRRLYEDLGLTLTMLGEEARVDLPAFTLDAPRMKSLRHAHHKVLRAGGRFEIVAPESVPAIVPALERVSTAWLSGKATQEKGFSNASFDAGYLHRFPVAVVRRGDEIVAFANLWRGARHDELSIDLMRYLPDAPYGTMDFLFSELLSWGRREGYRWFDFGMAPLSGIGPRGSPPLWSHVAAFAFRHGEHFYNFAGLRQYKAKFDPVWTPLYLASPGGAALPGVLLDVTALIAGSTLGMVAGRGRTAATTTAPRQGSAVR